VSACFRYFLTPKGLPQSNNGSAPPPIPTPVSVGGNYRRCSVRFMLRPAWLLAFLDWSDLTSRVGRRRRVHPSLPQRRSLTSRVGYDYTASPERYCGRTSTGWSAAGTGCAFLRSQLPWIASVGRCAPPGFSAVQTGPCRRLPAPYPVPFGSSASASCAGARARWLNHTFAGAAPRCLRDGIPGVRLPGAAVYPRCKPLRTSRRPGGDAVTPAPGGRDLRL
jgi:hypothetical protein